MKTTATKKLSAAQVEALRKMSRYDDGLLSQGGGARWDTVLVLKDRGLCEVVSSVVRKVTGRMGNALPTDSYYHDWTVRITAAGRAFLVEAAS